MTTWSMGAMIFGTGYAPFRGGPLNYARQRGIQSVVQTLHLLADAHGERFRPDAGWENFARPQPPMSSPCGKMLQGDS